MKTKTLLICFAIIFVSCSQNEITGFDKAKWINDSLACDNYRSMAYYKLLENKTKLTGLSKKQITMVLGRPNVKVKTETKNDFIYYLTGSFDCIKPDTLFGDSLDPLDRKLLIVSFNFLNLTSGIRIQVP